MWNIGRGDTVPERYFLIYVNPDRFKGEHGAYVCRGRGGGYVSPRAPRSAQDVGNSRAFIIDDVFKWSSSIEKVFLKQLQIG